MQKNIYIRIKRFSFLFFILMTASLFLHAQLSEMNYRIYSVHDQKEVGMDDIIENMMYHDILFFGEEHNDSVSHFLEHQLLVRLYNAFGDQTALSLEMFDRDVQLVMDEYLLGFIREKNFTKDARAWSNYRDYRPMIEFAKEKKLDVVCANAPSRYTNLAGRKGQGALMELPYESHYHFAPLPYDSASGGYYEKLLMLSGHSPAAATDTAKKQAPIANPMGSFNLMMAQSLWDATMAYSLWEYWKAHKRSKILQVNGRFHSDEWFAIVTQLENYSTSIRPLVISTGSDESFPNINWKQYTHLGDYIIMTDPKVPRTYKE